MSNLLPDKNTTEMEKGNIDRGVVKSCVYCYPLLLPSVFRLVEGGIRTRSCAWHAFDRVRAGVSGR